MSAYGNKGRRTVVRRVARRRFQRLVAASSFGLSGSRFARGELLRYSERFAIRREAMSRERHLKLPIKK